MPNPQKDWFSQFEEPKEDYFSQFEEVPRTPQTEPKGYFNQALDIGESAYKEGKKFYGEHPVIGRFLFGPSKEDLGGREPATPLTTAPGEVPGLRNAAEWVRRQMTSSGDYATGYLGGLVKEWGPGIIEGAFDPAQSGLREVPRPQPPKLLGPGRYGITPEGGVGAAPAETMSMREILRSNAGIQPRDIELKPTKSEVVPPETPKTAADFIKARNAGAIPKDLSFSDYKSGTYKTLPLEEVGVGIPRANLARMTPDELSELKGVMGAGLTEGEKTRIQTDINAPGAKIEQIQPGLGEQQKPSTKIYADILNKRKIDVGPPPGMTERRYQEMLDKFGGRGPVEKPEFARTAEGKIKIGADIPALGQVLGRSLYQGEITKIATKELLQNSVDATRHMGENARIQVIMGDTPSGKYIQVGDNGNGMTRNELDTVFTDLGASGKREDVTSSGGFGLAKAAPLLGGEKVEVTSVVKEGKKTFQHYFEGTPKDLLSGGVEVQSKEVSGYTPTGTTVRTYVPKDSYFYSAKGFVKKMVEKSPSLRGQIEMSDDYGRGPGSAQTLSFGPKPGKVINLPSKYEDVGILVPDGTKYADRPGVNVSILNNGMYQTDMHFGGWEPLANIPEDVIIDIRSNVPEGHTNYPFPANREGLRDDIYQNISSYIDENITKPGKKAIEDATKEAYNNVPMINGIAYYDVGKRFTPEEFADIISHPKVQELGNLIDDIVMDMFHVAVSPTDKYTVEKTGIVFDAKSKGLHVPNPGTDNSMILINPFASMEMRSPDQAATGIMHTIQHELAHTTGFGEDANFTTYLSDIIEKYGSNDLKWRLHLEKSLTGGTGDYLPEIQDILSKYSESRGRDSTYDDPIYRTGTKLPNKGRGREGEVSGDIGPPPGGAVGKLLDAIANSQLRRAAQDRIYSIEKARRVARFESVKEGGRAGFEKSMRELGGEYEKVGAEQLPLNSKDIDDLYSHIKFNKRITTFEKARAGIALKKLIDGSEVLQKNELGLLDRVYGNGFSDQIIEMQGGLGVIPMQLGKTANTMKSLMASIDLSAPFRQGLGLVHRRQFWNSFGQMFKMAASHEAFIRTMEGIEAHPRFLMSRDAGLFIADHNMGNYEEQFMNSYINDIRTAGKVGKIITEPFSASERAYVGFLNKLRFDTFNALLDKAAKAGYDIGSGETASELTKEIAHYVNVSTGRGSLGKLNIGGKAIDLNKSADALNTALFSPRLISSRLTVLNPKYYVNASPFVRKEAVKTLFAMAGFVTTASALGSIMGAQTKLGMSLKNLTNPDYGKLKFGKQTRLDPGGGTLQYIVAASKFLSGQATSSTSGNTYSLGGGFGQQSRLGVIAGIGGPNPSLLESKLSPMIGLADEILSGRTQPNGKPLNIPVEVGKRFVPLLIQDIYGLYQTDPDLVPLAIPGAFGMGIQNYQERAPKLGMATPRMNTRLTP